MRLKSYLSVVSILFVFQAACGPMLSRGGFATQKDVGGGYADVTLASSKLGMTVPSQSEVYMDTADKAVIVLPDCGRCDLHITKMAETEAYASVDELKKAAELELELFKAGEESVFDNGFELSYSYFKKGHKQYNEWVPGGQQPMYQARVMLNGTQYKCSIGGNVPIQRVAMKVCRSLKVLP